MSAQEYDNGLDDGIEGDFPGFMGYTTHDSYFLDQVCHNMMASRGGSNANCIYNEQLAGMAPPDGQTVDPYGWNLFYAGCGSLTHKKQ